MPYGASPVLDDGERVLRFVPSGLRPAAFVWLLVLAFGLLAKTELQQSIVAIAAVFIGLPLVLIGLSDIVRSGNERARPRLAQRLALVPARLVVGLLGAAGVLIGLGIAAWVAYNVFVERQPEFRGDPLSLQPLGIAPLLVIVGVGFLRSAFGRSDTNEA